MQYSDLESLAEKNGRDMVGQHIVSAPWFEGLLKVVVVCLIPWAVWTTTNIFMFKSFVERGDRFTSINGLTMKGELIDIIRESEVRLDDRIDRLPPDEWRVQIRWALTEARRIEQALHALEKEIVRDYIKKSEINARYLSSSGRKSLVEQSTMK